MGKLGHALRCGTPVMLLAVLACTACEQTVQVTSRPRLIPPQIRHVDLAVIAAPVYRLILPANSPDEPSRLIAVHVHLRSRHPNPVVVRPDQMRVLLPDGSLRFAFDPPRAAELVRRTELARADLLYLDDARHYAAGGLGRRQRARLKQQLIDELLPETRLAPGGRAEGYVVIDTGRAFTNIAGSPFELITSDEAAAPLGTEPVSLVARLSQPRQPPE